MKNCTLYNFFLILLRGKIFNFLRRLFKLDVDQSRIKSDEESGHDIDVNEEFFLMGQLIPKECPFDKFKN